MTKIKNSLSTYLEQAQVLTNNSIETIDKFADVMTSTEDSVTVTWTDPSDPTKTNTITIPSWHSLKEDLNRLNATMKTMTNITNGSGSRIRLSDGSYRKIIASKIPSEAPTITSVGNITDFNFKSNWFFEDMLNPCLYITWDMSNQISEDTERVMIQRYMLKCNTQTKIDVFDSNLKGRNDIDYTEFLNILANNKIQYTLDDEVKDLPPRSKRYYGTFTVIRLVPEKDLKGNNVKRYILDSLEFTDARSGFENTRLLTVGDYVEVNSTPTTTKYEVIYVDSSENKIGLKCVEGFEPVKIGVDALKISADQDTDVSADISIGFNEREVIFVKPIDPDSNIPANKWSPGVGFYTNELTYTDSDGAVQTLARFYQKNVVDFGQVLLSYAADYYPSIREGIYPDPPVLNYSNGEGDFKIVQINNQLTETTDSATFRSLVSDKIQVQSEINNLTDQISKQKELIQTTQYVSTTEKLKAQNALETLISQQDTLSSNYNSIVNNIKTKYESGVSATPKYRVRGFWDMPDSKVSASSGEQKIIKFKIRYRYLSESGNTNKEEEFTYTSGNSTVTGRFSNWNEIESKLRSRVKTSSGWEWADIDTSDPDAININQLDIPINSGEQVEIKVKSVSEAGWPSNPLESEWSNTITVAFSDFPELEADDVSGLVSQNQVDAAVANITQMYQGMSAHLATSFYTNDKYFAHTAETITSGFLTTEQTPITLYDKLQDLQNQITAVIEQINNTVGDVNVVLTDNSDVQTTYTLNEGSTTYINAGNYKSDISSLNDNNKNGAIVTKTFYLDISTDAQSGLYLLSKVTGDRFSMCPSTIEYSDGSFVTSSVSSGNDYDNYDNVLTPSTSSSTYYMQLGRYDLVPINLTNPEVIDFQVGSPNMYQSSQCRGQFVYSRFRNIGDTFDMYANGVNSAGVPTFLYDAKFENSEVYGDNYVLSTDYYGTDVTNDDMLSQALSEFNTISGSSLTSISSLDSVYPILNRLPMTWAKSDSASVKQFGNNKIILRATGLKNLGNSTTTTTTTTNTNTDTNSNSGSSGSSTSGSSTSGSTEAQTGSATVQYCWTICNDNFNAKIGEGDVDYIDSTVLVGQLPANAKINSYNYVEGYTNNEQWSYIYIDELKHQGEFTDSTYLFSITPSTGNATGLDDYHLWILSSDGYTYVDNLLSVAKVKKKYDYSTTSANYLFGENFSSTSFPSLKCYRNQTGTENLIEIRVYATFNVTYEVTSDSTSSDTSSDSTSGSTTTTTTTDGTTTTTTTVTTTTTTDHVLKLGNRINNLTNINSSVYTIIPKIQSAYGYGDWGSIALDSSFGDDQEYVTTHKIGYEDRDRYAIGKNTCNSYLFMSPVNHSDIQVDGDTVDATKKLKNGDSLRVPIIYQYRMTDYAGNIFGDSENKETDLLVKNARFANIIGIDIWTDRNALKPKQFDIVVYSTYDTVVDANTGVTKTSTQTLNDTGKTIANALNRMVQDNSSVTSKTNLITT